MAKRIGPRPFTKLASDDPCDQEHQAPISVSLTAFKGAAAALYAACKTLANTSNSYQVVFLLHNITEHPKLIESVNAGTSAEASVLRLHEFSKSQSRR